MNARRYNLINILATGVVVTVPVLLGLFWMRWVCHVEQVDLISGAVRELAIRPSGLLPFERADDPNLKSPSAVVARTRPEGLVLTGLGITQYIQSRMPLGPNSYVYRWEPVTDGDRLYYDPSLGLMVYSDKMSVPQPGGARNVRHFTWYAGPEGVGDTPAPELGRFISPLANRFEVRPQVIFDRGLRRFFAIHWQDRLVEKGPELADDAPYRPVQVGFLQKNTWNTFWLNVDIVSPGFAEAQDRDRGRQQPDVHFGVLVGTNLILVLDASGRIDLLDSETLEFVGSAGGLTAPATLFGRSRHVAPEDLAAFMVEPVCTYKRGRGDGWTYAGCVVGSVSRELTAMRLDVFDPNGRQIASRETELPLYAWTDEGPSGASRTVSTARGIYSALSGVPMVAVAKFAVENLHPPGLLVLSYFAAPHLEGTAAQRSLFLLPDSFVAMRARDTSLGRIDRFFAALPFLLLSIGLAALLSSWVNRDAVKIGLSNDARKLWVAATIVLGLPACLTYRLTRPKVALVTCQNCGLGRGPDRERCHHCGSLWLVPELTPPAWRVLDEEEREEDRSLTQADEVGSPIQ